MNNALRCLGLAALAVATVAPAWAQPADGAARASLRVCQDPNNLPFSNSRGEGIENRIAEIFGQAMGLPVSYYAFPQRMGFIRNTLRFKLPGQDYPCDVVMGWPPDAGPVATTAPYYRSTHVLVLRRDRVPASVQTAADFLRLDRAVLERLRIGVFDRSPAGAWLARHDLEGQGVPFHMLNADPEAYPGQIIDRDLAEGRIDAAIVWGPIAGYYAQRVKNVPLLLLPLKSEPGVKFDFAVSVGVRTGERDWQQQMEKVLQSKRPEILAVLREYGVPLVNEAGDTVRD